MLEKIWQPTYTQQAITTTPFSFSLPFSAPSLPMYVTLMDAKYDTLCHSSNTNAFSYASLTSLLLSSTSSAHALSSSSSSSWIIDLGASTHMTSTPTLLSSYKPNFTFHAVTIANGQPHQVKGYDTTFFTLSEPSFGLHALFVASTATSSLLWHHCLAHSCFKKLYKKNY